MMQSIVYNSFTECFVFYRGGYDEKTGKGIDPYNRTQDPLSEVRGYAPLFSGVAEGMLLHMNSTYTSKNAIEFFFGKNFDRKQSRILHGYWTVCFDSCGRLVFSRFLLAVLACCHGQQQAGQANQSIDYSFHLLQMMWVNKYCKNSKKTSDYSISA